MITDPMNAAAEKIAELWSSEGCDQILRWDPSSMRVGEISGWTMELSWWTDRASFHGEDYTTFTWQFGGDSALEAMEAAVAWLEALAPWAACPACDGESPWREKCGECKATGLAFPEYAS